MFHTLLTPEARGDTLAWVVDAYGIFGIHRLQALQEASLHPEASQHLPTSARLFFFKFCKCLHAHTLDFRIFFKPFINLFKIQVVDI